MLTKHISNYSIILLFIRSLRVVLAHFFSDTNNYKRYKRNAPSYNNHMEVYSTPSTRTDLNRSADIECQRDREIINALELNQIREIIENMTKFNQIEVLKIFCKHKDITINENKYGIHINLTELPNDVINELKTYINYVNTQEIQLNHVEKQKETFINTYFAKDTKDNMHKNI